ncbi:MAG: hypothetical protein ABI970_01305, partial [Chloroflexota bacterium]
MARKKDPFNRSRSLHRQMMWRIAPIVIVGFVILTAMGAFLHRSNLEIQLKADLAGTLSQRNTIINNFFVKLNKDLTYLARVDASRKLGLYTIGSNVSRAGGIDWETTLSTEMLDIANEDPSFYRQISFSTTNGSVWVQINNNNGLLTTSFPAVSTQFTSDESFKSVKTNAALFTPIMYETGSDKTPVATLTAFMPVVEKSQNNRIIGMVLLRP